MIEETFSGLLLAFLHPDRVPWARGVSVGLVNSDKSTLTVVACSEERELHVEATGARSEEDAETFAVESIRRLATDGFLEDQGLNAEGVDGVPTVELDLTRFMDEADRADATLLGYAGRVLGLPALLSTYERRLGVERFLCSGKGRVLAQNVLAGNATIVASRAPIDVKHPPPGLAVFANGRWSSVDLGGGVGPLGTASSLRTWTADGNTVSVAVCQVRLSSPDGAKPPVCGSVGPDAGHTELRALAEAAERHVAGVVDRSHVTPAAMVELGERALDPRRFVDYAPWQHDAFAELQPFSANERRLWVPVQDRDGSIFQVLADLVFYPFGRSEHRRHTSASSSGVAAHTSLSKARASAVAELVERDAFMRAWLSGKPATRVLNWESSAPASLVGPLVKAGWRVDVIQIAAEPTQPVLVAFARRGRQIALGSSSGIPEVALRKSLTELWSTTTRESEIATAPQRPEDVASPRDHALFALAGRLSAIPEFLRSSDREIAFADLAPELAWPEELYFYEWDFRLTRPFYVVRALAPSLVPISFGYGEEPYGRPDVADIVGDRLPQSLADAPEPHPFP
jgi:YcaO cyclodehydratase, ATP-ad Mg2+-binding